MMITPFVLAQDSPISNVDPAPGYSREITIDSPAASYYYTDGAGRVICTSTGSFHLDAVLTTQMVSGAPVTTAVYDFQGHGTAVDVDGSGEAGAAGFFAEMYVSFSWHDLCKNIDRADALRAGQINNIRCDNGVGGLQGYVYTDKNQRNAPGVEDKFNFIVNAGSCSIQDLG